MSFHFSDDIMISDINYWARYRDPDPANHVDLTPEQVDAFYHIRDYVGPSRAALPAAPQFRDLGPGQPLIRPLAQHPDVALQAERQAFLNQYMPPLGAQWRGTKFLGEGGYARVGLWEHTDPDPNVPQPLRRQIAVKELKEARGEVVMNREADNYDDLFVPDPLHILQMVRKKTKIIAADEGLEQEWDGKVGRIFLEYCPMGSLWDLLHRRSRL
jgi:hypothetical protein